MICTRRPYLPQFAADSGLICSAPIFGPNMTSDYGQCCGDPTSRPFFGPSTSPPRTPRLVSALIQVREAFIQVRAPDPARFAGESHSGFI